MPNSIPTGFTGSPSRSHINAAAARATERQGYATGNYDGLEGQQLTKEPSTTKVDARKPPSTQSRPLFFMRVINSRSPSPSLSTESMSTSESSDGSTSESALSICDRRSISPPSPLPFGMVANLGRTRAVRNLAGGMQTTQDHGDIDLELLDQESSTYQRLRQGAQATPWASVMDRQGLWAQHLARVAELEKAEQDRLSYEQMLEDQALLGDDSDK